MRDRFTADRYAGAARQQGVDVIEVVGAEAHCCLLAARGIGVPDARQRAARRQHLTPVVRVIVGKGQHPDLH